MMNMSAHRGNTSPINDEDHDRKVVGALAMVKGVLKDSKYAMEEAKNTLSGQVQSINSTVY
jgi:hypothetical protein